MVPVKTKLNISPAQRFFYEKSIELLQRITIDSYRLRLHNPKTLLIELLQVVKDLEENKLKNSEYANTLIEELKRILTDEDQMKFQSIKKDYFVSLLKTTHKDQRQISYAIALILNDNNDYALRLADLIENEIKRISQIQNFNVSEVVNLNRFILYFLIEIKSLGYSKSYLNKFITSIFNNKAIINFDEAFQAIRSLIERQDEEFTILLKINMPDDVKEKINIISNDLLKINKKEINQIISRTNQKIRNFLSDSLGSIYQIRIYSKDFYRATHLVREKINRIFDILHMGHSKVKVTIGTYCAVIGTKAPSKADIQNFDYRLDGFYKSGQKSYETFLNKLSDLDQSDSIDKNSLNKIYSGIRYLRLGGEAIELESQLLNYWIAIEYIFSIYNADSYTLSRLRNFYKKCHAFIYFKRILQDFHKSIEAFDLSEMIPEFDSNLNYLTSESTYDEIIKMAETYPLLAYRASLLKRHLKEPKTMKDILVKHQQNLDWNINRIYRIRNEIVHNAASNMQIETIVSHLRYYLVFILNAIIDFFLRRPFDINGDRKLTLDDYFIMREVQVSDIENNKNLTLNDLIKEVNPTEYLT